MLGSIVGRVRFYTHFKQSIMLHWALTSLPTICGAMLDDECLG